MKAFFESRSKIVRVNAARSRYDFVEKRYGNADKLFKEIGYRPSTPFKEGFEETITLILKEGAK